MVIDQLLARPNLPSTNARKNVDWKKIIVVLSLILALPCPAMEDWEFDLMPADDDSLFESPIEAQKELTSDERTVRKELRWAIKRGDKELIARFLADGGDPETHVDKFGIKTLLMYACEKDDFAICELLVQSGANVNSRTGLGMVPMLCADPNLKLYQLLVAAGANVDSRCCDGYSALILAAQDGDLASCELLIMQGASLYAKAFTDGYTPLITAACCNNEEKCKLMLNRQKKYNEGMILGLLYLKQLGKENVYLKFLYTQRNMLLKPHLEGYTLQGLLNAKTNMGKCAYDFLKVECLKPKGYEEKKPE